MSFSYVILRGGFLKQGDILEAVATSRGKWWRPILRKEQVNAEGKMSLNKGVQQILELYQISGLQVKSSAINQDHEFKKWNSFGWKIRKNV